MIGPTPRQDSQEELKVRLLHALRLRGPKYARTLARDLDLSIDRVKPALLALEEDDLIRRDSKYAKWQHINRRAYTPPDLRPDSED